MAIPSLERTASHVLPLKLAPLVDEPLFSVLIASYNYEEYIGQAIESVLNQTYQHFEMIICDDGSTDDSCRVILGYVQRDARIKLVQKENGGQTSALNAAYALASGQLIGYLDCDDIWYPQRMELVVREFLQHPEAGMVGHMLEVVHVSGSVFTDRMPRQLSEGWLAAQVLQGGTPFFSVVWATLRREVADFVYPLPEVIASCPDLVINARAGMIAPIVAIPQVLGSLRKHGRNVSGDLGTGKALGLQEVNLQLLRFRQALQDAAEFIKAVHGIQVDEQTREAWARRHLRELLLIKALLEGRRLPRQDIPSNRKLLWQLLFALPQPLVGYLYRWWCSRAQGPFKRLAHRLLGQPTQWW